jgi:hypothetical protein
VPIALFQITLSKETRLAIVERNNGMVALIFVEPGSVTLERAYFEDNNELTSSVVPENKYIRVASRSYTRCIAVECVTSLPCCWCKLSVGAVGS